MNDKWAAECLTRRTVYMRSRDHTLARSHAISSRFREVQKLEEVEGPKEDVPTLTCVRKFMYTAQDDLRDVLPLPHRDTYAPHSSKLSVRLQ